MPKIAATPCRAFAADLIDQLDLLVASETLGEGRLHFETPLPASSWRVESLTQAPTGALAVRYLRER